MSVYTKQLGELPIFVLMELLLWIIVVEYNQNFAFHDCADAIEFENWLSKKAVMLTDVFTALWPELANGFRLASHNLMDLVNTCP